MNIPGLMAAFPAATADAAKAVSTVFVMSRNEKYFGTLSIINSKY